VDAIGSFFIEHFQYALHFEVPRVNMLGSDLEKFMLHERRGHCEYFATTAALLLRHHGIPARYCVGYVAREKDDDVWIMRGKHAHAWCCAWIDGRWQIVDLTPPDWLNLERMGSGMAWYQPFSDWFQNLKQDFQIWKSDEGNLSRLNLMLWIVGCSVLAWLVFRLFGKRRHSDESGEKSLGDSSYELPRDIKEVELLLSRRIGDRMVSQTLRAWLSGFAEPLDEVLQAQLGELAVLHEESRFGGVEKSDEMHVVVQKIKTLLKR